MRTKRGRATVAGLLHACGHPEPLSPCITRSVERQRPADVALNGSAQPVVFDILVHRLSEQEITAEADRTGPADAEVVEQGDVSADLLEHELHLLVDDILVLNPEREPEAAVGREPVAQPGLPSVGTPVDGGAKGVSAVDGAEEEPVAVGPGGPRHVEAAFQVAPVGVVEDPADDHRRNPKAGTGVARGTAVVAVLSVGDEGLAHAVVQDPGTRVAFLFTPLIADDRNVGRFRCGRGLGGARSPGDEYAGLTRHGHGVDLDLGRVVHRPPLAGEHLEAGGEPTVADVLPLDGLRAGGLGVVGRSRSRLVRVRGEASTDGPVPGAGHRRVLRHLLGLMRDAETPHRTVVLPLEGDRELRRRERGEDLDVALLGGPDLVGVEVEVGARVQDDLVLAGHEAQLEPAAIGGDHLDPLTAGDLDLPGQLDAVEAPALDPAGVAEILRVAGAGHGDAVGVLGVGGAGDGEEDGGGDGADHGVLLGRLRAMALGMPKRTTTTPYGPSSERS